MVVILGAGLAGLSAAYHLSDLDWLLVEREPEVGGLCRSIRVDGFTFDLTGHLLHLRQPEVRRWALELLPGGWHHLVRSAWIHSHGTLTPYPFQANLAALPLAVRLECLLGFVETLHGAHPSSLPVPDPTPVDAGLPHLRACAPPRDDEPSFLDWILSTFGRGFARHFFVPYNTKLWRRDLATVTGDWVSWSIPRPSLADVLRGALTRSDKAFGYNPDFLYPGEGGIDHLPRAIAANLPPARVRSGCGVVELDAGRRRVRLTDGSVLEGPYVLSSLALPALAARTTDLDPALRAAARELTHVSIRAVNLGVAGPPAHPGVQWVYFPEPQFPFHRLGFPAALTPAMAPAGHHSIVAEIAFRPDEDESQAASVERTVGALLSGGYLARTQDVVSTHVVDIPRAYVVFDAARRRVLPDLFRWYLARGVIPLGRYGSWDYLAMEDSLVHGREVARWVRERLP